MANTSYRETTMPAPMRLNACLALCVVLFGTAGAVAQTAPTQTVGDLIKQAKNQQSQARAPVNKGPTGISPAKERLPELWSLTGSNHQLVAEIIYNEVVHTLRLHEGERSVGPWQIERYGVNGLLLKRPPDRKDPKGPELFLAAPRIGASLSKYAAALPDTLMPGMPAMPAVPGQNTASNSFPPLPTGFTMPPENGMPRP